MVLQVFNSDVSTNGHVANLGAADDAVVNAGVQLSSLDDIAIIGTGSGHHVSVEGKVLGHIGGMTLGDSALDTGQRLTIEEDGSVIGNTYGAAVIYGSNSIVRNYGMMFGEEGVISLYGDDASSVTRLINTGMLTTESQTKAAVCHNGEEDFRLVNKGSVSTKADHAYDGTDSGEDAVQTIVNSGKFMGGIIFGDGNDVYRGVMRGRVVGMIEGGFGDDRLTGGRKNDALSGDGGRDLLTGGGGGDAFYIRLLDDSLSGQAGRDVITDFRHKQHDKIVLDQLDAIINGADDAFDFIGKRAFSAEAGELRYTHVGHKTLVQGDIDGDGGADFAVELTGTIKLVEGDFIL